MSTYVYILTDSNRKNLHVGITTELIHAVAAHRELTTLLSGTLPVASRLIYHEAHASQTAALARFNELNRYTRMQKERLIRRQNPNWINLSQTPPTVVNSRVRAIAV